MKSSLAAVLAGVLCGVQLMAQNAGAPATGEALDFEVVSIKLNTNGLGSGGGIRSLPDGTMVMVNQPIRSIVSQAALEQTREVLGLPDWAINERYDVTTKPPDGSTREQRRVMMQRMFAERFNALVHVEQREKNGFALVVARRDGRLGPNLKPAKENCLAPASPDRPPTPQDAASRCGGMFGIGSVISGGMRVGSLTPWLEGAVGGPITDRTGLSDFYALELRYSQALTSAGASTAPDPSDAPDIFTALQEQLGLKLERETIQIPVLVIDRLERPTEN